MHKLGGAWKPALGVKALAAKPKDPGLIPRTHLMEGENRPLSSDAPSCMVVEV